MNNRIWSKLLILVLVQLHFVSLPNQANAFSGILVYLVKEAGEYLISKAFLDPLWDRTVGKPDQRIKVLDERLAAYQQHLEKMGVEQAQAIQELRQSLSEKTTPNDVRNIIQPSLDYLEQRIATLESRMNESESRLDGLDSELSQVRGRLDRSESRLAAHDTQLADHDGRLVRLERIFGQVGFIPPAPNLSIAHTSGAPQPNQLVREWFELLARSETCRHQLHRLSSRLGESNPTMVQWRRQDETIRTLCSEFYYKLNEAYIAKAFEREELLKLYREGSLELVKFNESLATYGWLLAANEPVETAQGLRLGVPDAFFGDYGSELLVSLRQAGVAEQQLLPFYTQRFMQMHWQRKLQSPSETRSTTISPFHLDIEPLQAQGFDVEVLKQRNSLFSYGNYLARRAESLQQKIDQERAKFTDNHPSVKALLAQQTRIVDSAIAFNKSCKSWIQKASQDYLVRLVQERPTTDAMQTYLQHVLVDLSELEDVSYCENPNDALTRQLTWQTLVQLNRKSFLEDTTGTRAILVQVKMEGTTLVEVRSIAGLSFDPTRIHCRVYANTGEDLGLAKCVKVAGEDILIEFTNANANGPLIELEGGSYVWLQTP